MENKILFENIIKWQIENSNLSPNCLREPIDTNSINEVEELIEEKFPSDLLELYSYSNGQTNDASIYVFFGLEFMSSQDIINYIGLSKSLIRGEVIKSNKSDSIIGEIVAFYIHELPPTSFFGLIKKWHKINAKIGGKYSFLPAEAGTLHTNDPYH
jgi:cell wall assembly regulator SMI1